jgi:hypothetical protein
MYILSFIALIIIMWIFVGMLMCTFGPSVSDKDELLRQYWIVFAYAFCGVLTALDFAIHSTDSLARTVGACGVIVFTMMDAVIAGEIRNEIKRETNQP